MILDMNCDLEKVFGDLADTVSSDEETEFVFSADMLSKPPAELLTEKLIVKKGMHYYDSYTNARIEMLHFQGRERTYKLLGLLFFAKVFHATPSEIRLILKHPSSDIAELVLDYDFSSDNDLLPGYQSCPNKYVYIPQGLETFPLADVDLPDYALPHFNLTNRENSVGPTEKDWATRDVVRCAGWSAYANILFASLLLDISRPEKSLNEFVLETELGFGGVGKGSVEVKIWLPDSLGWDGVL